MFKRAMSVTVVCTLVVLSLFSLAGPAAAGKPVHITEHRFGFVCEEPPLTNESGTVIVAAVLSDVDDPFGIVLYWPTGTSPETDEPALRTTEDVPEITGSPEHIEAVFPMETSEGVPAGSATIVADLVPTGDPIENETFHEGNRLIRDRSVDQLMVITSGTLTLPGGITFDLAGCPGFDLTIDVFITQPDAFVNSFSGILVLCDIATEDYALQLGASAEESGAAGEIFFTSAQGALGSFSADLTLTPEEFTGAFPLENLDTGEPAGDAVVDATFTRDRRVALDVSQPGQHSKLTGWLLAVSGTVTIPTAPATVVDLSSCFAVDGRQTVVEPHPGQPQPEEKSKH